MELFQSSLLKYWEFKPSTSSEEPKQEESKPRPSTSEGRRQASSSASHNVETLHIRDSDAASTHSIQTKGKWSTRLFGRKSRMDLRGKDEESTKAVPEEPVVEVREEKPEGEVDEETKERQEDERIRARKRVPVIFFDEAHKLQVTFFRTIPVLT
jgi:hypothetical protein